MLFATWKIFTNYCNFYNDLITFKYYNYGLKYEILSGPQNPNYFTI